MNTTTCPRCGADATGNFCSSCGASLGGRNCPECGAVAEPGARFCTICGSSLAAGEGTAGKGAGGSGGSRSGAPNRKGARAARAAEEGGSASQLGWWIAGATMTILIAILAFPILVPQESREVNPGPTGGAQSATLPPAAGGGTGATGAGAVDLSSMTPQQAAERLYGRVMGLLEAGDTASVSFFLPMALSAHEQAEPLNADGLFHYASLQRVAGQPEAALATAERILEETPTHLLGLYAAATAAEDLGQEEEARQYWQRILDAWEAEQGARNEYLMHERMMPDVRAAAEAGAAG